MNRFNRNQDMLNMGMHTGYAFLLTAEDETVDFLLEMYGDLFRIKDNSVYLKHPLNIQTNGEIIFLSTNNPLVLRLMWHDKLRRSDHSLYLNLEKMGGAFFAPDWGLNIFSRMTMMDRKARKLLREFNVKVTSSIHCNDMAYLIPDYTLQDVMRMRSIHNIIND